MIVKYQCSCLLCKNVITTNNLGTHYASKQCQTGKLFVSAWKERSNRELKCKFCAIVKSNVNAVTQHELRCDKNPDKISLDYLAGGANFKNYYNDIKDGLKKPSNQYIKAELLGLEKPTMSDEGKERLRQANLERPQSYASKESQRIIEHILNSVNYNGQVYHAKNNREFFLRCDDNIYFYDLVLHDIKYIVEYQGVAFHPKSLSDDFRVPFESMGTKEDLWNRDRRKEQLALSHGFKVRYIWSDNADSDLEIVINELNDIIQNRLTPITK